MRLKIEAFSETILLTVTQDVSDRSIAILFAGLKKHQTTNIDTVYLDFSGSEISDSGKKAILDIKNSQSFPIRSSTKNAPDTSQNAPPAQSIPTLIFIGPATDISDYPNLETALTTRQTKESLLILEKLQLEKEVDMLSRKQIALSETSLTPAQKLEGRLSLFKLNIALKRVSQFLIAEIKRRTTRNERMRKKGNPDLNSASTLHNKKTNLLNLLAKMGLISG